MTLKAKLIEHHQRFAARACELCLRKSRDYSGAADALATLRLCTTLAGIPAETGIVVRMLDKVGRLQNLTERTCVANAAPAVPESIVDTATDLANYAILHQLLAEVGQRACPRDEFEQRLTSLWQEQSAAYVGLIGIAHESVLLHGLRRPKDVLRRYVQECFDGIGLLSPRGPSALCRSSAYTIASRASVVALAAQSAAEGREEI